MTTRLSEQDDVPPEGYAEFELVMDRLLQKLWKAAQEGRGIRLTAKEVLFAALAVAKDG